MHQLRVSCSPMNVDVLLMCFWGVQEHTLNKRTVLIIAMHFQCWYIADDGSVIA